MMSNLRGANMPNQAAQKSRIVKGHAFGKSPKRTKKAERDTSQPSSDNYNNSSALLPAVNEFGSGEPSPSG